MTKAQEQMRKSVESGIEGFIAGNFSMGIQPTDSLTGHPLTLETSRVYYYAAYAYSSIEDAFLESVGYPQELNSRQLQAWVNYHWQYARLELAEDFSDIHISVTGDMLERRNGIRESMSTLGYKVANK